MNPSELEGTKFSTALPASDIEEFQTNPRERKWTGPFTFVQGADTQFGMIDSYIFKKKEPKWDKEITLSEEAIKQINLLQPKPKFFVVCGDMLDAFPNEENGQAERRDRQYVDFVRVFKDLDPEIKLVCVCGNHDIEDNPTFKTIQKYRRDFGPDFFSFWCGGVKFVVLNSQYFKSGELVPEQVAAQNAFMETITDPTAKHIVVFQHIPFFLSTATEDTDYFTIDMGSRIRILDKLHSYGVRYIFCGHYHRNAGGFYRDMNQVVTSAIGCQLGNDKSGFRVVRVEESTISNEYVDLPIQFSMRKDIIDTVAS